jgi:hypothetical protein
MEFARIRAGARGARTTGATTAYTSVRLQVDSASASSATADACNARNSSPLSLPQDVIERMPSSASRTMDALM